MLTLCYRENMLGKPKKDETGNIGGDAAFKFRHQIF